MTGGAVETYARVVPTALGQPYRVHLGALGLRALGVWHEDSVRLALEGDTLEVRPDSGGSERLRRLTKGGAVTVGAALLREAHAREPLPAGPVHAEVRGGSLFVALRRPLGDQEYRWRRYGHTGRQDAPLAPPRTEPPAPRQNVTVPLPPDLVGELRREAAAVKLTLPAYLLHLLERRVPPGGEPAKTAGPAGSKSARVRVARASGRPLGAGEMLSLGLPPASDEAWLRARLADGYSFADMAREFGGAPSLYSKWGRSYGIRRDRADVNAATWRTRRGG